MSFRRKIYITITVFVLFYILLITFVVLPIFRDIKKSSQELQLARNKFHSLTMEEEQQSAMVELYRNYQPDLERMEKIFVDPSVPLELLNFLEETASSSQVQLNISSITKRIISQDPWPSLLLQISTSGRFSNFLQFLDKLENNPYLIEVLDLIAKENLDSTTVNLSIKVFTR